MTERHGRDRGELFLLRVPRWLFVAAGVDFDQWRALTAVLLRLDFRLTSLGTAPARAERRAAVGLFLQFMFYTLFGLLMTFFVAFGRDRFLAGTISMTVIMFIVGTAVLLDHNSAIASPADYGVLGFRPISSRTYFAVRLTNVLVYTWALTTTAAWMPIAALFVKYGAAVGMAGILAFYACSTSTALTILASYAWMLRLAGPEAIRRALSYVQLVLSFTVYGGYFLMSRLVSRSVVASVTLPATPWLLLFPGTWFAAYLEIAAGRTGPMQVIPAAASVAALAALVSGLGGRLSLDYSERLGAMMSAGVARGRTPRSGLRREMGVWLFRAGEARAVALLVRSQFRNDLRFRMGVLSILPLTLMYVYMGVRDGAVGDPFVSHQGFSPVTIAVMMFPSMLKMHLTRSDSFRASWIFFSCPSDRMKIVRASKNVLAAFFLVPYLIFLLAIFTYVAGNLLHVMVHILVLGLLSHLALQTTVLIDPELPFSRPAAKGQPSRTLFFFMCALSAISGLLTAFSAALYGSATATAVVVGVILLAGAGVDRLTRARVERQTGSLELEG